LRGWYMLHVFEMLQKRIVKEKALLENL